MAKATYKGPEAALARYEQIVSMLDDVERKGAANPYTSVNGWMASFLDADGVLAIRMDPEPLAAFLAEHDTTTAFQYGKNMPEFAVVPASLFDDVDAIVRVMQASHADVAARPPKSTKR